MPMIGVLSSIQFRGVAYENEFLAGSGMSAKDLDVRDNLGYDPKNFNQALLDFNNNTNMPLFVTVGGSVTELAANNFNANTKPFISIDGGPIAGVSPVPRPSPHYFRWRVDLDSINGNQKRKNYLKMQFDIQPTDIGLLSNTNSSQHGSEHGQGWAQDQEVTLDQNDTAATASQKLKNAFALANVIAVIVSADPYFMKFANELVQEAQGWAQQGNRRVCYPLRDYADHAAANNKTTVYGPELVSTQFPGAYSVLGQKAVAVINDSTSHGTEQPPIYIDNK